MIDTSIDIYSAIIIPIKGFSVLNVQFLMHGIHVGERITIPKKIIFTDKVERIGEVQIAMRETKDKRLFERYQCIHMLLMGESQKKIAKILDRGADTVGDYVQSYCSHGLQGLLLQHSPGRPKRLTLEQEQELYQTIVEKTPADVGFPANMNWTSLLIRDWIKSQFQVQYSERGTREGTPVPSWF
jgi:transposase